MTKQAVSSCVSTIGMQRRFGSSGLCLHSYQQLLMSNSRVPLALVSSTAYNVLIRVAQDKDKSYSRPRFKLHSALPHIERMQPLTQPCGANKSVQRILKMASRSPYISV